MQSTYLPSSTLSVAVLGPPGFKKLLASPLSGLANVTHYDWALPTRHFWENDCLHEGSLLEFILLDGEDDSYLPFFEDFLTILKAYRLPIKDGSRLVTPWLDYLGVAPARCLESWAALLFMTKQSLTNDPDIVTRFERQFTNNCTRWSFASSTAPKAEKVHNIKRDHQGVIINGVHYDWLVIYGRPQPHPSIKHTPQELSWMQEWPARIVWLNTVMEKNLGLHILPDGIRLSLTKKTALNLTTTYAGEPRSHRCLLFLSAHQSASSLFHQGLYIGKELRTLYCPLVYPLGLNKILERTTFMVQFLSAQLI